MASELQAEIEATLADRRSGSRAITEAILEALKTASPPDPFYRVELVRLARITLSRAPVFALVHDLWHTLGQRVAGDPSNLTLALDAVRAEATRWEQQWREATALLSSRAVEFLASAEVVATISNSGAVGDVLHRLAGLGRRITVWCAESLPGGEGRDFSAAVSRLGHRVEVTADADMPSRVASADLLLTGADAVDLHTFINKTGTGILMEAARATLVLAESAKWAAPSWGVGRGVSDSPHRAFGMTDSCEPLSLFERVPVEPGLTLISETGAATVAGIEAQLARKPVWPPICN